MSHFVFSISDVTKVGGTLYCKAEFPSKRSAKCLLKIQLVCPTEFSAQLCCDCMHEQRACGSSEML